MIGRESGLNSPLNGVLMKTSVPQSSVLPSCRRSTPCRRWLPGLGLALFSAGILAVPPPTPAPAVEMTQSAARPLRLPPELQGEGKWQAFQALWRELDALQPTQPGQTPPDGRGFIVVSDAVIRGRAPTLPGYEQRAYYQALDAQRAGQMRRSLAVIFGSQVDSPSAQLLLRLTRLRIQHLSATQYATADYAWVEQDGMPMCRAAPPICSSFRLSPVPPSLYLVAAIDRIEFRTKTLLALREKGAINDAAFREALSALQQDARLALTLDQLTPQVETKPPFDLQSAAPLLFDRVDFGLGNQVDLRRVETWERAVHMAGARPESAGRQTVLLSAAEPDNAQQRAQVLLTDLAAMRQALEQLAPLLAALEQ